MGYRIRVVPEVKRRLDELRRADPGTADLVDAALVALRDRGSDMGPPLVVPVKTPGQAARPDLDYSYQRQLEMLSTVRRAVADIATARKRLELQIHQLEEVIDRQPAVAAQLADLRRQFESVRGEEERLEAASRRLHSKVDNFRTRKEMIKAADAAADAKDLVEQAEAELAATGANGQHPSGEDQVKDPAPVRQVKPLPLSELRPGAPEMDDIRILFTVELSRTMEAPDTAVILAVGTKRDWLRSWYAESVLRARTRYERDRGDRS